MKNESRSGRKLKKKIRIRTHHERVNEKVIVLEGIESGGRIDPVLVGFGELESCNNKRQCSKHQEVENLH